MQPQEFSTDSNFASLDCAEASGRLSIASTSFTLGCHQGCRWARTTTEDHVQAEWGTKAISIPVEPIYL